MTAPTPHDEDVDVSTALAIAMLAYAAASMVHEGLGHGLACRELGGEFTGFGTSFARCRNTFAPAADAAFRAGGTLAGGAAGLLITCVLRLRRGLAPHTRYAGWLFAALLLVQGASYVLIDSVLGLADWRFVGRYGGRIWQLACACGGAVMLWGAVRLLAPVVAPLLGGVRRRARWYSLVLLPWLAIGGGVMTGTALLSREPGRIQLALIAFYFNFGCGAVLPASLLLLRAPTLGAPPPVGLRRHPAWILAGTLGFVLVVAVLGPGVRW
jgi:hypothetical protein